MIIQEKIGLSRKCIGMLMAGTALSMVLSFSAQAQDQENDESEIVETNNQDNTASSESDQLRAPDEVDEIVATGTRRSLRDALQSKKDAAFVLDALSADDFGNLPDLTAGEALVRLPGVTGGAGTDTPNSLSIRGFSSEFGLTTLNGRLLTSDRDGRNVRTNLFPSSLLSQVAVFKTPTANMVEGGLAGTVVLQTQDPLDYIRGRDEDIRVRARGFYVDDADLDGFERFDGTEVRFDGSIIKSLMDDKMAFAIGYDYSDNYSGDQNIIGQRPELEGAVIEDGFSPILSQRGQLIFDDDGDRSTDDPFNNNDALISPDRIRYDIEGSREIRNAGSLFWTYEPTPNLTIKTDLLAANEDRDFELAELSNNFFGDGITGSVDNSGYIIDVLFDGPRVEFKPREREETTNTLVFGGNVEYRGANWEVSADAFYSLVELDRETAELTIRPGTSDDEERPAAFFSSNNDRGALGSRYLDFDPANPDELSLRALDLETLDRKDESLSFRLDFQRSLDFAIIDSVQTGLRYQTREKQSVIDSTSYLGGEFSDFLTSDEIKARRILFLNNDAFSEFSQDSNIPREWVHASPVALLDELNAAGLDPSDTNDSSDALASSGVMEDTFAGYLLANVSGDLGKFPFSGNFGVRVVKTNLDAFGSTGTFAVQENEDGTLSFETENGEVEPFTDSNEYTNVLPSANLAVDLSEDFTVRFGAAKTIARPSFEAIFPQRRLGVEQELDDNGEPEGPEQLVISGGNSQIEPYESKNLDVSFEWSPNRDTLFAVAGFYKDIDTIITTGVQDRGTVQTSVGELPVRLNTFQNIRPPETEVSGLEFQAQTVFSFLPKPFDGLGVQFNYTYIDSRITEVIDDASLYTVFNDDGTISGYVEDQRDLETGARGGVRQPLPDITDNITNLTVYYDYGPFSARVAGQWRSDNFERDPGNSNPLIAEGRPVFDFSVRYDITDNLSAQIQGRNITNQYNRSYYYRQAPINDPIASAGLGDLSFDNRTRDVDQSGRTLFFGLSYSY